MFASTGSYFSHSVAASVPGPHGPETLTRYAVVTPDGALLPKSDGHTRLFLTAQGARSHAWRLNHPNR
jgi:hypothetical protein